MRSRLLTRRRLLQMVGGLAVLLGLGVAGLLYLHSREPGNVSNLGVEFHNPGKTTIPAAAPASEGKGAFDWSVYGYDKSRTRYLPLAKPLRPPFADRWRIAGSVLLEFPPAMGAHSLFLLKNNAALYAIVRKNGVVRWKRKLGYLAASSPAYAHNTIYCVILERGQGINEGRVVAVSAQDGHTRWSRKLPSRAESSPLISAGNLYFGSEDGWVYAMRASDGYIRWRTKAPGAVKGGLALANGRLFFGDYSGHMQALRASDGHLLWRKGTNGGKFGLKSGNFYSTAAAAFGRVYIGNTDGFVYSYGQTNGALAWRHKTGGFVYASPAVAQVPGAAPSVYIGSYDKTFYALDARTGRVRWSRKTQGKISGGATVLGDLVFYSTLSKTTSAVDARTGQLVWSTRRGAFNAVVSNGRGIFLVGLTNLFGLDGRPPRSGPGKALSRAQKRAIARRIHLRQRRLNQRVAARRRLVHQRNLLRRRGVRFCYRSNGKFGCHRPAPIVCFTLHNGRTYCQPRHNTPAHKP